MPAPGQTAKTPLSELWKKYGFGGSFTSQPVAPVPQPTPDPNDPMVKIWNQFEAEHGFPIATAESRKTPGYFTPQYLDWQGQFIQKWYSDIAKRNEETARAAEAHWNKVFPGTAWPGLGKSIGTTTTTLNGSPISNTPTIFQTPLTPSPPPAIPPPEAQGPSSSPVSTGPKPNQFSGLLYNYPFNPYKPVSSGEPAIGSGNQALQSLMDKSKDLFSGGIPGGMGAGGGAQNWMNMF